MRPVLRWLLRSMVWDASELEWALRQFDSRAERALHAATDYFAGQTEDYAKMHAPWNDQTGNARNGLAARAVNGPGVGAIVLYHQVPYGIWLETRWSGRYQTIVPTLMHIGPQVFVMLTTLFKRIR